MLGKKRVPRWLLVGALLVSLCGWVGCGGGGDDALPPITGTFNKTVVQAGAPDNDVAIFDNQAQMRTQALFKAADIQGSGYIKAISFRFEGAFTGSTIQNVTIKLGHTAIVDNLTTTFANNVENGKGSQVTVFGPAPLLIPAGADNSWFTIPLNGKFNYNGVDDLVVETTAGAGTKAVKVKGAGTAYDAILFSDNAAATTGSIGTSMPDAKFTFAGGADEINRGFNLQLAAPFNGIDAAYNKVQLLFSARDIDGSGLITGIGFMIETATVFNDNSCQYTVRMGHAKRAALVAGFDNNFNAGAPVTVADNLTLRYTPNYPASGGWLWLPLAKPFLYNGADNLVVEIKATDIKGMDLTGGFWLFRDASGANTLLAGAAGDNTGSFTYGNSRYSAKFRFAGGTLDVITAGDALNDVTFPNTFDNITNQHLYQQSELGTKGSVTKVEFRLFADTVAASYSGFTVKLAQTTAMTLGSSLSGNAPGAATGFSGTFNVPAGLKQGDWVEIPIFPPFPLDPAKNLVVQTFSRKGTILTPLKAATSPAFVGRHAMGNATVSDTASVNDFSMDQRLTIQ